MAIAIELVELTLRVVRAICNFIATSRWQHKLKNTAHKIKVVHPVTFSIQGDVHCGNDFFAGAGLHVSNNAYSPIEIGNAVMLGPDVKILGGNHIYSDTSCHMRYITVDNPRSKGIVVQDGTWIGANSMLLSGAFIGEGAILGANAVVSHYIPPYCIAYGVPAKHFKARFSQTDLKLIISNVGSAYSYDQIERIYMEYGIEFATHVDDGGAINQTKAEA